VTHVCTLPEWEVLLLKFSFSILTILVHAQLLGHAPTSIPPTQYALMVVNIFVLTPSVALVSNGLSLKLHQHWGVY
jgi:hypothetical protein